MEATNPLLNERNRQSLRPGTAHPFPSGLTSFGTSEAPAACNRFIASGCVKPTVRDRAADAGAEITSVAGNTCCREEHPVSSTQRRASRFIALANSTNRTKFVPRPQLLRKDKGESEKRTVSGAGPTTPNMQAERDPGLHSTALVRTSGHN
jgi:hypothetical protein